MLSWRELLARMVFMPTTRMFVTEWETLLHILLGWVGRSMASMEEFDCPLQGHSSFSAHRFCLALSYLPSWGQTMTRSLVLFRAQLWTLATSSCHWFLTPRQWGCCMSISMGHRAARFALDAGGQHGTSAPALLAGPEVMFLRGAVPQAVPAPAELPQVCPHWVLWRFAWISCPDIHCLLV